MKKIILLLLVSFSGVSQVFYLDTTFRSEPVRKLFSSPVPLVTQFADGTLYLKSNGNVFNGETRETYDFLLNTDGKIIKDIKSEKIKYFDYRLQNWAFTHDRKILITVNAEDSKYSIIKLSQEGLVDSTFRFKDYSAYIHKIFPLPNENFMALFMGDNTTYSLQVFDKNGNAVSTLNLTQLGLPSGMRIDDVVYNDYNEFFLLLVDANGNKQIVKTTQGFVPDAKFPKIQLAYEEGYTSKLVYHTNGLLVYTAGLGQNNNKLIKLDRNGNKLWQADFGSMSQYMSSQPYFYKKSDGGVDLIYFDGKHIKIDSEGKIDVSLYDRKLYANTRFLHAFDNGSYWVMRDNNGIIERMNADGVIDSDFKIQLQTEKELLPNQIRKLPNKTYLLDFYTYPYDTSPYSIRYSPFPNAVRIYNDKHQMLYEFFDAKTTWKTYQTERELIVRGAGSFYALDTTNRLSVAKDTLLADDVIDFDNGYVYRVIRNISNDTIIRYKIGAGLDTSFMIADRRIGNFKVMNDKRIAVMNSRVISTAQVYLYYNMYLTNGKPDTTFRSIILDNDYSRFYGELPMTIDEANGYLINQMVVGETANIVKQRFLKFDKNGNTDKSYQSRNFRGGYFRQFQQDGSILMNTNSEIGENETQLARNFMKIDSSGNIDSTFTLLGADNIFGFEFFDENTLYAVTNNTLRRFIKQPLKKDEYFYLKPIPEKMAWNKALPVQVDIDSNIEGIKVEVEGAGRFENGYIYFEPETGIVSLRVVDAHARVLAWHRLQLIKATPVFIYDVSEYYTATEPFEFKVQSSSGLPVKISVNGQEYMNSILIDPIKDRQLLLSLKTEGNELFETVEVEIYLMRSAPLSLEPESNPIKYYPNPVADKLFIEKNAMKIETLSLKGVDGRERTFELTEHSDKYELAIKDLIPGVYLLVLQSKNQQVVCRIIKE